MGIYYNEGAQKARRASFEASARRIKRDIDDVFERIERREKEKDMAIDRKRYPITYDEAMEVLNNMLKEFENKPIEETGVGDKRPEILKWVIGELWCIKNLGKDHIAD